MEKKTIGGFIAALRKANGLTQKQLAEKLNVSDKAVSRWERDEAMPDLSLIPELAEIFGVTTDEILRGQRHNPEAVTLPSPDKGEKQRKRLLADKKSKYQIRSTISIGLSIVGLIAAMICNFGFLRAYIGFMVGAVFFVAAVVCQIGFIITNISGLDEEMLTDDEITVRNGYTFKLACGSFTVAAALLAACLPLIIYPFDTYQGLNAGSWLLYGLVYTGIALGVCLVAFCAVGSALSKRGLVVYAHTKEKALHGLRVRFVRMGVLTVAVLFLGQLFVISFLPDALRQGIRFNDWDSFKTFMETPTEAEEYIDYGFGSVDIQIEPIDEMAPWPQEEYFDENGNPIDEPLEQILDQDGRVLCEYYHRNGNVSSWTYSAADPENPQITVYTASEVRRVDSLMENIIIPGYCFLYPMAVAILYFFYREKAKEI